MSRKFKTLTRQKRLVAVPDPFYISLWVSKLVNKFMCQGRKSAVEKSLREAFSRFKVRNHPKQPLPLLFRHLLNYRPLFVLTQVRRGRSVKEVPVPLTPRRQLVLVLNWYISAVKSYANKYLAEKIYRDLKAIKTNRRTALVRYRKRVVYNFRMVTNRFNQRFRWK